MPRRTLFSPTNTDEGWRINIPAKYSKTGKRERHFYKTFKLADAASKKLKEGRDKFGENSLAICPTLADQATAAAALLKPLGMSLLDAVSRFVEMEIRNRASLTMEDAVAAFRAAKDDLSSTQEKAYRLRGEKLIEAFPGRMVSTISGEELHSHLDDTTGGAGAYNQNLRLVRAMWRWWAKPPRKWCDDEAVKHLEAKGTVSAEIGTLTAKEAAHLLRTAELNYPETVPAYAIALFTGMRQKEIDRLRPEHVTSEGITLPAMSAKTKRRRFIEIPAPLKDFLAAYPIGDTVTPSNWQRKDRAVRRLAGWKVWTDMVEPHEPEDTLPEWPANALRHTAATVSVALGKPLEQLIFEHGHSGGVEMLKRHYVGAMPKAEAVKIWSIAPHGKTKKRLEVA
jgi:integrase/recombinase XerD